MEGATLSAEQRGEIERKIQDDKVKLNALISEQKAINAEKFGQKQAAQAALQGNAPPKPATVEEAK